MAANGKSSKPGTVCSWKRIPPPLETACKIASTSPCVTRTEAAEAWERGTTAKMRRDSNSTKQQHMIRSSFTKLQTDRQSWCDSWCCRRERPVAVPPHDEPWPAASSRQELAACRQAGRSGRGHHDRHPDHALTRAVSSPEHSCLLQPSRFLL